MDVHVAMFIQMTLGTAVVVLGALNLTVFGAGNDAVERVLVGVMTFCGAGVVLAPFVR